MEIFVGELGNNTFTFNKDDLDVAYLLGIYLTDGYVKPDCVTMRVRVIDQDIAQNVVNIHNKLFGRNTKVLGPIQSGKSIVYEGNVYSKSFCDWLITETELKSRLPLWVYKQSNEWVLSFLSGLLDGDGFINISKRRYKNSPTGKINWSCDIGLCGIHDSYIKDLPKLLNKHGIRFYENTRIDKRPNRTKPITKIQFVISSFIENNLFFQCNRKSEKLLLVKEMNIGCKLPPRKLKSVQRLDTRKQ